MADNDRVASVTIPSRTLDDKRSEKASYIMSPKMVATEDFRPGPARPDPETGEVRAGPGDAGLEDRPEVNAGNSGIKQMSNSRLAVGLGIGAVLAILVLMIKPLF